MEFTADWLEAQIREVVDGLQYSEQVAESFGEEVTAEDENWLGQELEKAINCTAEDFSLRLFFTKRQVVDCDMPNNPDAVFLSNTLKCKNKLCGKKYYCKKHNIKRCPECGSLLQ